jgi:hypothetical protein
MSSYAFFRESDSPIIKYGWFDSSTIVLFILSAFLSLTAWTLKRIPHTMSRHVVPHTHKNEVNSPNEGRYSYAAFVMIILTGFGMEVLRGMWLLWLESLLLVGIVMFVNRTCQHLKERYVDTSLYPDIDNTAASSNIYNFFLRYGVAFSVICPIHVFLLIILLT